MRNDEKSASISIYIVGYKPYPLDRISGIYQPIFVRSYKPFPEALTDDSGDNIASKNSNFCECTSLYWIWKNDFSHDIVGMDQYRRYLASFWRSIFSFKLVNEKEILFYLKRYDVLVPAFYNNRKSLIDEKHISTNDFLCLRKVILEKTPQYIESFDFYFSQSNTIYNNIFIAKKSVIEPYWEWVFPIFFELEKRIDLHGTLLFGYLSERLLNVFIIKNQLKIHCFPIWFSEGKNNWFAVSKAKLRVILTRKWGKRPSILFSKK